MRLNRIKLKLKNETVYEIKRIKKTWNEME